MEEPSEIKLEDDGSLALLERGYEEIPEEIATKYGKATKTLNLSENNLKSAKHLEKFTKLETLILDNNGLTDLDGFPKMKTLKTLWFNNNNVEEISVFLKQVSELYPNLTYLSMMRNPASPTFVIISEEDAAAAHRHRLYVIYRLPKLNFLDAAPVKPSEREEAKKKGQFLEVRRAKKKVSSEQKEESGEAEEEDSSEQKKRKPAAFLGLGSSHYDGRQSEGNRFILNEHL